MSWDVSICNDDGPIELPEEHGITGGTYAIGERYAELNITYNYGAFYAEVFKFLGDDGFRELHEQPVRNALQFLARAISKMEGEPDPDYWAATEGNAKKALVDLFRLCAMCPLDAVVEIR